MIKSQRYGTGQRRTTLFAGETPVEYMFVNRELEREERKARREARKADKERSMQLRRFTWQDNL